MPYIGILEPIILQKKNYMTQMFELATERLVIRTPQVEDTKDLFTLMNDEDTALNTGFRRMESSSEAEGKIRRGITNQNIFSITLKENPTRTIGIFEFITNTISTISGKKKECEICYFLHKDFRGKGYMTEAVGTMKKYLFIEKHFDTLLISVFPRNDSSRRVAIKNGFTFNGLKKKCGVTGCGEVADLEFYVLDKEDFLNPGNNNSKKDIQIMEKQKWVNEGGILYPIPGSAALLSNPGSGIFRIYEDAHYKRLGLEKIDETFSFNFKLYDLDCEDVILRIIKTWTSKLFTDTNKNLGVIFNGLKGTGKTIAAKLLSNRIGMPVIIISKPIDGMLEFIQSLCFESVILIDEAEKTFNEEREVLLKMIDGVYNCKRKLYILTTNKLTVDENLLGRPGRIRYIKEFGNLSTKAINDVIDDNLLDASLKSNIIKLVDTLEISTIDILKSIIDECNIMGEVPTDSMLNIPKAKYKLRVISFDRLDNCYHQEVKDMIKNRLGINETVEEWLMKTDEETGKKNKNIIEEKYDFSIDIQSMPSVSQIPYTGQRMNYGTVTSEPDMLGFFTIESDWDGTDLYCVSGNCNIPSLYRGLLN
mgnify:CR=1 FL=1